MALPEPEPGMVIPYAYLWRDEQRRGLEEGRKIRPAVIVLRVDKGVGQTTVVVAPITHASAIKDRAVELPARVKRHLDLDDERSWIVLDEVNQFTWPGYDVRSVPGDADRYSYGFLPPRLFDAVISRLLTLVADRRVMTVKRD